MTNTDPYVVLLLAAYGACMVLLGVWIGVELERRRAAELDRPEDQ